MSVEQAFDIFVVVMFALGVGITIDWLIDCITDCFVKDE